jgi:O-antigen ligase
LSSAVATGGRYKVEGPAAITGGALLAAIVIGIAIAADLRIGLALALGLLAAVLLVYRPTWAVIGFVPLVFLEAVPALNLAGKAVGFLIAVAWLGAVRSGQLDIRPAVQRHRRLFELLALLVIWLCLSSLWATDVGAVFSALWRWVLVALLYVILSTWLADRRLLVRFAAAFVIGAVLAVGVGIASGMSEANPNGGVDSRLEGGAGDPNFLAAGLVPAMIIAVGLIPSLKQPLARVGCVVAILICALGIGASQSRGGLIALFVALVLALVLLRGVRIYALLLCLGVIGFGAIYFVLTPTAWERVTQHEGNGGSGREDLWKVAWKATEQQPVEGVGLQNYEAVAKNFTRDVGPLHDVRKIAEEPHLVHNTYLEALVDTGIVGLGLFLAVIIGSCMAMWRAARIFERLGESEMELLARCVLVGTLAMASAAFFVSAGVDKRLWMLFALGPALLLVAEAGRRRGAPGQLAGLARRVSE